MTDGSVLGNKLLKKLNSFKKRYNIVSILHNLLPTSVL